MKIAPKIFLLDDDDLIITMLTRVLRGEGYEVRSATSVHDVVNKIRSWGPAVTLLDIRLPERSGIDILEELMQKKVETQVVMLTADDTAESAVRAMKLGAVDYFTKPFNVEEIKIVVRNVLDKARLEQEVGYLRKIHAQEFDKEIIGVSPAVVELKSKIEKMASASVRTILMTGESGTGKELFARYAHRLLHDAGGGDFSPFVRVNCAALPETLLESELFGHEKGAFTDAKAEKKGLFELAQGGSILLDEIGDMKLNLQGKLLRVLEERVVRPVGGHEEIPVDATVIATTNRNLQEAVERGEFRMDLFFRLSTFYLHVPPLRERAQDIPAIARHFLADYATRYNKRSAMRFSPEAEKLLTDYGWPGNIRELRNLIERLVVLETEEELRPEHLPPWIIGQSGIASPTAGAKFDLPENGVSLEDVEKGLILQALERTKHNKTQAAKLLNISYDTLRYQVKKFGLE